MRKVIEIIDKYTEKESFYLLLEEKKRILEKILLILDNEISKFILEENLSELKLSFEDKEIVKKELIEINRYLEKKVELEVVEIKGLNDILKNKIPKFFEFQKKKIRIENWDEFLIKILEYFFTKDKILFKEIINNKLIKVKGKKREIIGYEKKNMIKPKYLKEGIYIETNLSPDSIRNIIKKFFIFYRQELNELKIYCI